MSLPIACRRCVISEWPNRWMLRLQETIHRGVDTAHGCNCPCFCLQLLSVACVHSRFGMIARASGLGMGVGMFWWPLGDVGVLAMPDVRLNATRRIESSSDDPQSSAVLLLLVSGVAVGQFTDCHCVWTWSKWHFEWYLPRQICSANLRGWSSDHGF